MTFAFGLKTRFCKAREWGCLFPSFLEKLPLDRYVLVKISCGPLSSWGLKDESHMKEDYSFPIIQIIIFMGVSFP